MKIVNIIGFLKNKLSFVMAVLVFIFLASSLLGVLRSMNLSNKLVESQTTKLEIARNEYEELNQKLEVVQSSEYLEKELREKLGLARPGEIIVILPEIEKVKKMSPNLPVKRKNPARPNYQKWIDLFLK